MIMQSITDFAQNHVWNTANITDQSIDIFSFFQIFFFFLACHIFLCTSHFQPIFPFLSLSLFFLSLQYLKFS